MAGSKSDEPNYRRLRTSKSLRNAWSFVKQSGTQSNSADTRRLVHEFGATETTRLRDIADRLLKRKFAFGVAKGILIPREGKPHRPIVLASIEARIVQRALLDELLREPRLRPYFVNEHSFGGVQNVGRGDAINAALRAMRQGARFFVRSDIRDFFTKIPRERALDVVLPMIDEPTRDLLRRAVSVELENAAELGELRTLFPDEERGVAQGFCLSSLFGNVVLADFDRQMNDRGVKCLRYVDDFLLLADGERRAMKAFESALRILGELGLVAYDPRDRPEKAACGPTTEPFEFLGCAVQPGLVAPSRKSMGRLLEKVDERLRAGWKHIDTMSGEQSRHASFSRVMVDVGNIVHGWRQSFEFCKHPFVFKSINEQLQDKLDAYVAHFSRGYFKGGDAVRRALIGVPSLTDPISRTSRRSARTLELLREQRLRSRHPDAAVSSRDRDHNRGDATQNAAPSPASRHELARRASGVADRSESAAE